MVNAIVAAKSHVSRSNSEMLQERRVVGSRSKRTNACFRIVISIGLVSLLAGTILPLLVNRLARFRILDVAGRTTNQFPKRRHRRRRIVLPINSNIDVQVSNRFLLQLRIMLFGPFGRTFQSVFLSIPTTQNDCAAWVPAVSQEL